MEQASGLSIRPLAEWQSQPTVSRAGLKMGDGAAKVFGETPKTTVGTTVPPEGTKSFQLNLTCF